MTTTFPNAIDGFNNPSGSGDYLDTPGVVHSAQHANINDAMLAVQGKMGATGTADSGTFEYRTTKRLQLVSPASGIVPLSAQGALSQSANLFELKNSGGSSLVSVNASGKMFINNSGAGLQLGPGSNLFVDTVAQVGGRFSVSDSVDIGTSANTMPVNLYGGLTATGKISTSVAGTGVELGQNSILTVAASTGVSDRVSLGTAAARFGNTGFNYPISYYGQQTLVGNWNQTGNSSISGTLSVGGLTTFSGGATFGSPLTVNSFNVPQMHLDDFSNSPSFPDLYSQLRLTHRTNLDGSTNNRAELSADQFKVSLRAASSGFANRSNVSGLDGKWAINGAGNVTPADTLVMFNASGTELARLTSTGMLGIGVTPEVPLDLAAANGKPHLRLGPSGNRHSLNVTPVGAAHVVYASGAYYDSALNPPSMAQAGSATQFVQQNNVFNWYGDTGLTPGAQYTRSQLMNLSSDGLISYGSNNHFGRGATAGTNKPYLTIGDLGTNDAYVDVRGDGALTSSALVLRSLGSADMAFATNGAANFFNRAITTLNFSIAASGAVSARGSGNFGTGSISGVGPYIRLGDFGSTTTTYLQALGSAADVGINIDSKGAGVINLTTAGGTVQATLDNNSAARATSLQVRANGALRRVVVGANDSAGSGFSTLRVANY